MGSDAYHWAWLEKILWGVPKQDKVAKIDIGIRCAAPKPGGKKFKLVAALTIEMMECWNNGMMGLKKTELNVPINH